MSLITRHVSVWGGFTAKVSGSMPDTHRLMECVAGKSEDSMTFGSTGGVPRGPGPAAAAPSDEIWAALHEQRKILLERQTQLQSTLSHLESEEMEIRGSLGYDNVEPPAPSHVGTSYPIANDPLPFDVVSG